MKHLAYQHQPNVSLVVALSGWVRGKLFGQRLPSPGGAGRTSFRSRILTCASWLIVLVVQAALILVVREVIELCHGVIGLYLDLAKLQLDLTSQYVSATSK